MSLLLLLRGALGEPPVLRNIELCAGLAPFAWQAALAPMGWEADLEPQAWRAEEPTR